MKKFTIIVLYLAFHQMGKAQPPRPLEVGDLVPDLTIDNVINYKTQSVRLSEFSGKLVILDFWGTTCASCISLLPKLDCLQKKFADQVQIITVSKLDTKEKVISTLNRSKSTRNVTLPVVVTDTMLSKYFPYDLVSHLVWIDSNRIVRAITGADYVTTSNMQLMLSGQAINWPVKKDMIEYDDSRALLEFAQPNMIHPEFLYYSAFTGYLEGISPGNGRKVDSANQIVTMSLFNMTIPSLAKFALDFKAGAHRKEFVLEVKDTARLFMPANEYPSVWNKQNRYSYCRTLPLWIPKTEQTEIYKKDMSHWLGVQGYSIKKEIRQMPCLVLVRTAGAATPLLSKGGEYEIDLSEAGERKMVNASLAVLVNYFNQKSNLPWIINESGLSEEVRVDIKLNIPSLDDIEQIRSELKKFGLDLLSGDRERPMYVIKDVLYMQR